MAADSAHDPHPAVIDVDRLRRWTVRGDLFLLAALVLGIGVELAPASLAALSSLLLKMLGVAFIIFLIARVVALSSMASTVRPGGKLSLGLPPLDSKEKP